MGNSARLFFKAQGCQQMLDPCEVTGTSVIRTQGHPLRSDQAGGMSISVTEAGDSVRLGGYEGAGPPMRGETNSR
jgi:hypothetical protein